VVWLAQQPDDDLRAEAQAAADRIGLPLTLLEVGTGALERALADLVAAQPAAPTVPPSR
jgi:hypothetical protein